MILKHLLATALLMLLSLTANAETVYSDATKAIMVKPSESDFVIKLESNPTTGYAWFIVDDYDKSLIDIKSSYYTAAEVKEGVRGTGGMTTWQIHLKPSAFTVPSSMTLHFLYAKPWETAGDVKEFTIRTFMID